MLSELSTLIIRHRMAPFMMGMDATIAIIIPHQSWLRPVAEEIAANFAFWKLRLTEKTLHRMTSETNVRVYVRTPNPDSVKGMTINLALLPHSMPLTTEQEKKIIDLRANLAPMMSASNSQMMFY